jgi:hypothetical protein
MKPAQYEPPAYSQMTRIRISKNLVQICVLNCLKSLTHSAAVLRRRIFWICWMNFYRLQQARNLVNSNAVVPFLLNSGDFTRRLYLNKPAPDA